LFDEGNPYMLKRNDLSYVHLYLYSFLLSYATLKKHYNHVTMYCNQKAYDTFIKYIPYDDIIIMENKNSIDLWNGYKIDVLKTVNDECIHVDPDVFVYDDLFLEFIHGKGDILIQNIVSPEDNNVIDFAYNNKEFLINTKIFTKEYDGRCAACGVLGMRKKVFEPFFRAYDILHKEIIGFKKKNGITMVGQIIIIEELLLYLIAVENNYELVDILPYDLILKHGFVNVGNFINYCHVWQESKFKKEFIDDMRRKIQQDYFEYHHLVVEHDNRLKKLNILI